MDTSHNAKSHLTAPDPEETVEAHAPAPVETVEAQQVLEGLQQVATVPSGSSVLLGSTGTGQHCHTLDTTVVVFQQAAGSVSLQTFLSSNIPVVGGLDPNPEEATQVVRKVKCPIETFANELWSALSLEYDTFPQFKKLPEEVKCVVWKLTLEPRTVCIHEYEKRHNLYRPLYGFRTCVKCPVIRAICRSSRQTFHMSYKTLKFRYNPDARANAWAYRPAWRIPEIYFHPELDEIHMTNSFSQPTFAGEGRKMEQLVPFLSRALRTNWRSIIRHLTLDISMLSDTSALGSNPFGTSSPAFKNLVMRLLRAVRTLRSITFYGTRECDTMAAISQAASPEPVKFRIAKKPKVWADEDCMRRELSQAEDLTDVRTSYQTIMARDGALLVTADRIPSGRYAVFQVLPLDMKKWLLEQELELFARHKRLNQLFDGSRNFTRQDWNPATWGTAHWSDDLLALFSVLCALDDGRIPAAAGNQMEMVDSILLHRHNTEMPCHGFCAEDYAT